LTGDVAHTTSQVDGDRGNFGVRRSLRSSWRHGNWHRSWRDFDAGAHTEFLRVGVRPC
jgi:hypothetical protein